MTLERVAFGAIVLLALGLVGLGDIAAVTSVDMVLLAAVRGLLPLAIGLALLATLLKRRMPAFPSTLAWPAAAWLAVLVVSAALAPSNRLEALASLERPASGALLAWAVYELCRTRARWRLLARPRRSVAWPSPWSAWPKPVASRSCVTGWRHCTTARYPSATSRASPRRCRTRTRPRCCSS